MKATKKSFEKKMNLLTTDEIIALIKTTWTDCTGELFREVGFYIIEEREGEEYSDRIYSEIWHEIHAA